MAAPHTLAKKRFVPAAAADEQPMCTASERRRLLTAQRVQHKRRETSGEVSRKVASWNAGVAVPFLTWMQLLPGTVTPPVGAHHLYMLIVCGAVGGCIRCRFVASGNSRRLLEGSCRRWCPIGTKGQIKRLAKGLLPHPESGDAVCPDGSLAPSPILWHVVPPADALTQSVRG